MRIIIAWGNAPGVGVYDVKALKGRIKMGGEGAALGFNKAPFQGWVVTVKVWLRLEYQDEYNLIPKQTYQLTEV